MPIFLAFILSAFLIEPAAEASASHVEASLISGTESLEPGQPLDIGIHLQMEKGWHIYWINPGESGLAPTMEWNLPAGFHATGLSWPYPKRLQDGDIVNFGYTGEVFLLDKIKTAKDLSVDKVTIAGTANWVSCKDICIPDARELSLVLPVRRAAAKPSRWHEALAKAKAALPVVVPGWRIKARIKKTHVEITLVPPRGLDLAKIKTVEFFPLEEGVFHLAVPFESEVRAGSLLLRQPFEPKLPTPPKRLRAVLVSESGWDSAGRLRAMLVDAPLSR